MSRHHYPKEIQEGTTHPGPPLATLLNYPSWIPSDFSKFYIVHCLLSLYKSLSKESVNHIECFDRLTLSSSVPLFVDDCVIYKGLLQNYKIKTVTRRPSYSVYNYYVNQWTSKWQIKIKLMLMCCATVYLYPDPFTHYLLGHNLDIKKLNSIHSLVRFCVIKFNTLVDLFLI